MGRTLFEKIWQHHLVEELDDGAALIYIDRVFLHERTGSIALKSLEADNRQVVSPEHVFCTMDHIVDTVVGRDDNTKVPSGKNFILATREACIDANIKLFDVNDPQQGIVHVVSPELGIVQPGATLVCPDSHTCSQGALGALAWGIGSSEAEHALATKTLRVSKPKTMKVNFNGELGFGVSAKDMILHLIGAYSAAGGAGYVIEFAGSAVEALDIEGRLTLCNMAVEFSAFSGLVAPDEKAIAYLKGREYAPKGDLWQQAVAFWQSLFSDEQAQFDKTIEIDCADISPTITWGNSPQHACSVNSLVPSAQAGATQNQLKAFYRAYEYMDLQPGTALKGLPIGAAFIGSCTNSRISDLRLAAKVLKGRKVADNVNAICVPGSTTVKRQAEAEGLDKIFIEAGFEWREAGCSMCFFAGGESFGYRQRVVTSTNRNFESRQGPETRSHLASPATVAASAIAGCIADVREYL
ncbi:3-isopropylmalate/(R)-2-methylmalate dehydratase large subunit [Paraglaciecola mesophila KMM 241]|uniref:3-isopropylmalate dehydratase n=1 Tax=Paraglaciecola mesophila KMM 241 TaxID=1128912 RepID=K6YR89_9ALTE|nr:3-isopropylmalate dehydratase large subunit [Paraglaciecola mesophila]GAC26501.1 3-isopropylmalate/(R)-2-methylmalate dehydratase large subunit [Paraglaciecola mesophila KMM 241]